MKQLKPGEPFSPAERWPAPEGQQLFVQPKPGEPFNPRILWGGGKLQGVVCLPDAILRQRALSSSAQRCWAHLAKIAADHDGLAVATMDRLAAAMGTTSSKVANAIQELTAAGLIERVAVFGVDPRYRFLWHGIYDGTEELGPRK